ncbi:MAG TPA: hypothetical protein PLD59_13020 [Tepidisphaeraceae bacterium]|nr:hypothetical protein [Tepidisphaeraceae bacterium]
MNKSFKDWLSEGEQLYNSTLSEFQQLEAQLMELEQRLAAKKAEVNQIAAVVGKPPVESTHRRMTAEIIDPGQPGGVSNSPATIARALTGRGLGR